MDLSLKGKVALVTASSKGLGRAVAQQLAAEGAHLAICSRSGDKINEVAEELRITYGCQVLPIEADVSNASSISDLIKQVGDEFGRIDALLCNAGGPASGAFLDLADEAWERAFQTNLMSVVRLIQTSYPLLKQNGGRILTIASSSVKVPIPGLVLSNTFRTAVAGLMKTLSLEFAKDGVLVNTICPGRISTDRLIEIDSAKAQMDHVSLEEVQSQVLREIPLGRYGDPQELGAFAAYLLSPANSYLTGSTFFFDGGMVKAL